MTTGHAAYNDAGTFRSQVGWMRVGEGVATGLLAVASTVALGAAGTGVAVLAIAVLAPVVLLGALMLTRGE